MSVGSRLLLGFAPRGMISKTSGLLLSFKSEGAEGLVSGIGISSSYCGIPLSVYKEVLTPIFRVTV